MSIHCVVADIAAIVSVAFLEVSLSRGKIEANIYTELSSVTSAFGSSIS